MIRLSILSRVVYVRKRPIAVHMNWTTVGNDEPWLVISVVGRRPAIVKIMRRNQS